MEGYSLVYICFLIFSGAAVLASIALYTKQPLIIAYITLGALLGPYGFEVVHDPSYVADIASIGIIFLLFLLGLDMKPENLFNTLRKTTLVAILSSLVFAITGYIIAWLFGFNHNECLIIGAAMMFSSTIIGIKLLPTTVLHHRHTGELLVGILLLQDVIAIITLLILGSSSEQETTSHHMPLWVSLLSLPLLVVGAGLFVKYVMLKLFAKFDRIQEYLFLAALGWCLGLAMLAHTIGLSYEIGAFIAGVTLATSPIALFIANSLKPLRDFFLIIFFFSLGAGLNLKLLGSIIWPALTMASVMLLMKPAVFRMLLHRVSETKKLAWDVGFRLGQISEFSLLIAYLAVTSQLIGEQASLLIQTTAIITFTISTYIIIFNYPNPMAVSEHLRRD